MPFSVSRATIDPFARLKALRPPPSLRRSEHETEPEENRGEQGCLLAADGAAIGSDRLALILGASVKRNRHGEHLSLHCWHGGQAPCIPEAAALKLLAPEAPEEVLDGQQWLFLDTETTGLMGGTGTYPFLVGLAWWEGGGLEVEQLFMREYSEERSVLAALAERLAERPVLVTFNGKSFDWPLLETRYRMTRSITPPVLRAHLDFLHPARNLWRLRLGSVRLSQLERHVLGWDRGADLVSELIPRIYLDFVRHGHANALVPVFQHNQMDLRGLAGLSGRILSLLGEETVSQDGLPGEMFIRMAKEGSTVSGLMDSFATAVSLAFQYGVPLQVLCDKFSHTRFEPSGWSGNPKIGYAKSLMDYLFRWLELRFLKGEQGILFELQSPSQPQRETDSLAKALGKIVELGDAPTCQFCGSLMVRNGSCYRCMECGSTSGCS